MLHTDNGGEYVILELQSFLREQGVIHEISTLYVYQQNGYAEWLNCTLLEKAQFMWLEACLPDFWQEFAIVATTHIYNYTSVRCLK